jgi:hypothetical protein
LIAATTAASTAVATSTSIPASTTTTRIDPDQRTSKLNECYTCIM